MHSDQKSRSCRVGELVALSVFPLLLIIPYYIQYLLSHHIELRLDVIELIRESSNGKAKRLLEYDWRSATSHILSLYVGAALTVIYFPAFLWAGIKCDVYGLKKLDEKEREELGEELGNKAPVLVGLLAVMFVMVFFVTVDPDTRSARERIFLWPNTPVLPAFAYFLLLYFSAQWACWTYFDKTRQRTP